MDYKRGESSLLTLQGFRPLPGVFVPIPFCQPQDLIKLKQTQHLMSAPCTQFATMDTGGDEGFGGDEDFARLHTWIMRLS